MTTSAPWLLWLLAPVAVIVLMAILAFNRLVQMRQLTRNAWSDVDVFLKRRAQLIPNLVECVKGYASHEQATLERVVEARSEAAAAGNAIGARSDAERRVSDGLSRLLVLAERYPELRAASNFLQLQEELVATEKSIASARQYFNACVRDYNTLVESFPSNIVASIGGFQKAEFFELDDLIEREAPKVTA